MKSRVSVLLVAVLVAAFCSGCYDFSRFMANSTASLGGDTAGDRGTIEVVFINNTPYNAVFTAGTFDHTDQNSEPDIEQFGKESDELPLAGNSQTSVLSFRCARTMSIGSNALFVLMNENLADVDRIESAEVPGVEFFEEQGEDGDLVSQGSAPSLEILLGADFACESLVVVRFEFDDVGDNPFRIDYQVIASDSNR